MALAAAVAVYERGAAPTLSRVRLSLLEAVVFEDTLLVVVVLAIVATARSVVVVEVVVGTGTGIVVEVVVGLMMAVVVVLAVVEGRVVIS